MARELMCRVMRGRGARPLGEKPCELVSADHGRMHTLATAKSECRLMPKSDWMTCCADATASIHCVSPGRCGSRKYGAIPRLSDAVVSFTL